MSVKFDVKITSKVMFDFLLYHTYTSVMGIIGVVFGMVNLTLGIRYIVEGDSKGSMMYFIFAGIFLFAMPVYLRWNADKQVSSSKVFKNPITYEMTDEGVQASQQDKGELIPWSDFIRVISTKGNIVLYQSRNRAVILPREDMGVQQDAVIEMISTHVTPSRVKIRR